MPFGSWIPLKGFPGGGAITDSSLFLDTASDGASLISAFGLFHRVSQKKRPAFEWLLLPEYASNDILQYLIQ